VTIEDHDPKECEKGGILAWAQAQINIFRDTHNQEKNKREQN